jgi:hypothetical protein
MKTYPNHDIYRQILKAMTPQDKLLKAFELSDLANAAFRAGLRGRHPDMPEDELDKLYLEKRKQCHNRNY